MEGKGELVKEGLDRGLMCDEDDREERVFKEGELVEYWAGAFVRGYRTEGEPAFVKRVEGGGKYAIRMVGSGRGKYRQVEWRQMYKDGSFNKHSGDKLTRTVRSTERMQEKATEEAEAKYGEVLRKTKRELKKACKLQQDSEQQAENRQKQQSKEAEKAKKELTVVHKRQLEKISEGNRQDMATFREDVEDKERQTRKCIRQLRQDLNAVTDQVGIEKEEQAHLDKQLLQERKKRMRVTASVDIWRAKCEKLDQTSTDKEDRLINMRQDMTETTRAMRTLKKRMETGEVSNLLEVNELGRERDDFARQLQQRNKDVQHLKDMNEEEKNKLDEVERMQRLGDTKRMAKRQFLVGANNKAKKEASVAKAAQQVSVQCKDKITQQTPTENYNRQDKTRHTRHDKING
jgi:chromosome segregation ATPase